MPYGQMDDDDAATEATLSDGDHGDIGTFSDSLRFYPLSPSSRADRQPAFPLSMHRRTGYAKSAKLEGPSTATGIT